MMTVEEIREALWREVEFVLLDMDGTLLDKYFDDYFWEHLVPQRYAEIHNITFGRAKEELLKKYKRHEGTLNWTDIDFWSQELGIDIPALKEQIRHLIEVHPHVEEFLDALNSAGKKVFLATNAHFKTLTIKLRKTALGKYFNKVVTSFELGAPKERQLFWERAEKLLRFKKEKTLFVDDTEEILFASSRYGIRYNLLKMAANSREKEKPHSGKFPAIKEFKELLP